MWALDLGKLGFDRVTALPMGRPGRTKVAAGTLDVVADRGNYDGREILACETAGITVTLPKPMTSSTKAAGRFGLVYVAAQDVYRCPARAELMRHRHSRCLRCRPLWSDPG